MSSMEFDGNNNRAAGRDYYERYEHHEHFHGAGLHQLRGWLASLSYTKLCAARRDAQKQYWRKQLRQVINFPYLAGLGLFLLSVVAAAIMLSDVSSFLKGQQNWKVLIPFVLIGAFFTLHFLSRQPLRVIKQQALEADLYLHEIDMEIARRREADRLSRTNRRIK